MKVNTYEAFQHIAPFVVQHPLVKDYKKDSLHSIRCYITNAKHAPIMISGFRDNDAIKVVARMIIDMVDPDSSVMKDADLDYSHETQELNTFGIIVQHRLTLIAGDTTYRWEWVFTNDTEDAE